MILALILIFTAIFFYLLILGSSRDRDWAMEDREQVEYLRRYLLRKQQRKK